MQSLVGRVNLTAMPAGQKQGLYPQLMRFLYLVAGQINCKPVSVFVRTSDASRSIIGLAVFPTAEEITHREHLAII